MTAPTSPDPTHSAELMRGEPCPTCGLTMSLFHTAHPNQDADHVRHVQVETPHWDTKVRCACKADFTSRCEFWKHQADAYLRLIDGGDDAQK